MAQALACHDSKYEMFMASHQNTESEHCLKLTPFFFFTDWTYCSNSYYLQIITNGIRFFSTIHKWKHYLIYFSRPGIYSAVTACSFELLIHMFQNEVVI